MKSNIEIKARASDFKRQKQLAKKISDTPAQQIAQEDIFFNMPNGRFKLRVLGKKEGELIYYQRPDTSAPKVCEYVVTPTTEPDAVKKVLSSSLGVRGTVRKKRTVYNVGNTRIHLDQVEGLGDFIELEYVMRDESTEEAGLDAVANLMEELQIREEDLVGEAYIDLITTA